MENLNEINELIKQNYDMAIIIALAAIFIAGIMFSKVKVFAIVLLLSAFYTLYTVVSYDKIKDINVDDIKNRVKNKVIEKLES